MRVTQTALPGVRMIETDVFRDDRGYFLETWQAERYTSLGLPGSFVQDNLSHSARGVLRGLHLQHPHSQGKLVYVIEGEMLDVAVDVRVGSPHFGRSVAVVLSGQNHRQLYIPPGFAHGFCVTSQYALLAYKCTTPYRPSSELGVLWSDPDLAIAWPHSPVTVSARDQSFARLRDIPQSALPSYAQYGPPAVAHR